ncbi:hypothetical protein NUU61_005540 [Penicillium alfredii]|uniref:Uncharacterized protein n=1 Tax=Penicillium alfredii TaxID=1506179 RepID=A0A9W9FA16_9EURO|nr:uncharacterized protein NUU61_005540 [Penicillium alfredii]KAJ5096184.1 hypothetical protein NUU61_005540 [Penicillium alfredii]
MGSCKSCQDRAGSGGSSSSTDSDGSDRSQSTATTVISDRTTGNTNTKDKNWPEYEADSQRPRDSVSTYATTSGSIVDVVPQEPRYEVEERQEDFPTEVLSSTPSSFAGLFPSSRRLLIRHDDTTVDGNMNLRVDTLVPRRGGYQQDVTLFHLRMYDLFSRKCSLRRYCRDSGREVCHSARKEAPDQDRRPVFRRSWSSVLAGLRPSSSGQAAAVDHLKRQDSGFESANLHGLGETADRDPDVSDRPPALEDAMLLEFSNYAHVVLKRRGPGVNKRYEYVYWSTRYQWRREFRKEGDLREVSFFLVDTRTSRTIAHMVPEILTPLEAVEEDSKGGWIPPSSLWISDESVYEKMPDVADAIVATGLMTLVDDFIRRRWHRPSWVPPARSSWTRSLERMGPRRLIGEVLQRRGSA